MIRGETDNCGLAFRMKTAENISRSAPMLCELLWINVIFINKHSKSIKTRRMFLTKKMECVRSIGIGGMVWIFNKSREVFSNRVQSFRIHV